MLLLINRLQPTVWETLRQGHVNLFKKKKKKKKNRFFLRYLKPNQYQAHRHTIIVC